MQLTLSNFEEHLPTRILNRGLDYFEDKLVVVFQKAKNDIYAEVAGSNTYPVKLTLEGEIITEMYCSCPYFDKESVCKHVAAVIYTAVEVNAEYKEHSKKTVADNRAPIDTIIDSLSESELRNAISNLVERFDAVNTFLLAEYSHYLGNKESKKAAKDLVNSRIKQTRKRYGFIEYHDFSHLCHDLYTYIHQKETMDFSTVFLAEEIITKLAGLYQKGADDSSGDLSMAMSIAFDRLNAVSLDEKESGGNDLRKYIHKLACRELKKQKYKGFDWEYDWAGVAANAVLTEKQAQKLMDLLEEEIKEKMKENSEWNTGQYYLPYMYQIIKNWKSKEDARAFLEQNIEYRTVRDLALELYLDEGNDAAFLDLIQKNKENDPNSNSRIWDDWMLRYYQKKGDKENQIKILEKFFFGTPYRNFEYYEEIKSLLTEDEIKEKREEYIKYYQSKSQGYFSDTLANLFMEAERWQEFLHLFQQDPDIRMLNQYFTVLSDHFPQETIQMYVRIIPERMDDASNRNHYRQVCRDLKKILKLGGEAEARQIAENCLKKHPRRRAMREELERIGLA
ncbi:MAG: hypothetical protein GYB31_05725 [Bacteroidetes bacterium]|nr:hypothetical protein [Bacteroidota bacterium]